MDADRVGGPLLPFISGPGGGEEQAGDVVTIEHVAEHVHLGHRLQAEHALDDLVVLTVHLVVILEMTRIVSNCNWSITKLAKSSLA